MDRFLIIGSNSFSGSHFINYLINKKKFVLGVSRSDEINKVFLPYKWSNNKKLYKFHKLDLNKDIDRIIHLIKKKKINIVVNFASQSMVSQSWATPLDWYYTNVISQVKLHDELRKLKNLKKYVHVSTPEVYGSTKNKIKENYNFSPSTPYAASRAACDLHLRTFYKNYNFPVVFTRAANVYGPGQQLYRLIPKAILCGILGNKFKLDGGGKSLRSFIHIKDVVDATYKICLRGVIGQTYHLANTEVYKIKEVVNLIANKIGTPMKEFVEIAPDRPGKDQAYLLNSKKIFKEMKWRSKTKLDDGIDETILWIKQNINIIKKIPSFYKHKK